jgi:hypothetical protein
MGGKDMKLKAVKISNYRLLNNMHQVLKIV